jgi:hypothetical protein
MHEDITVIANEVTIEIEGCDASTNVKIKNATIGAVNCFKKLSDLINATSFYNCMPRMYVHLDKEDPYPSDDDKTFDWLSGNEIK